MSTNQKNDVMMYLHFNLKPAENVMLMFLYCWQSPWHQRKIKRKMSDSDDIRCKECTRLMQSLYSLFLTLIQVLFTFHHENRSHWEMRERTFLCLDFLCLDVQQQIPAGLQEIKFHCDYYYEINHQHFQEANKLLTVEIRFILCCKVLMAAFLESIVACKQKH